MPDLSPIRAFARKAGRVPPAVPRVPPVFPTRGTGWGTDKTVTNQCLEEPVPHVPHVPPENNDAGNEIDARDAFEERAAVLEYDAGFPREVAEAMARSELAAMGRGAVESLAVSGDAPAGQTPFHACRIEEEN